LPFAIVIPCLLVCFGTFSITHENSHTVLGYFSAKGIDYVILMDSVVDVIFFADILHNFHTTFVGPVGEV
jgi:hypothetical protein